MSDKKEPQKEDQKPKPNPDAQRPKIEFVLNHAPPGKKR